MTYTVAKIEPHTWAVDHDGREHPVVLWDCGHRHRTMSGAYRCLRSVGIDSAGNRTTASLHNHIRHADPEYTPLTEDEELVLLEAKHAVEK